MSTHNTKQIVIAIVDDHPIVVEGLQRILSKDDVVQEIQTYSTGQSFIEHLHTKHQSPDIVLLDITLPDINGIELCQKIKSMSTHTVVLGFSNHSDRSLVMQLLASGASGYILKNATADEILRCVHEALKGQIAFSEEIRKIIANPSASEFRTIPPLTQREKQVLRMIADGKTSIEISEELKVSPLTIETHRRNLMQKLSAKNVAGLIKTATEMKLL